VDYYDSEENVEKYIQMASGYDGKSLIAALRAYLPRGATVLELGMGPGKDLLLLKDRYHATGSDSSNIFLDRFKQLHPDIDVRLLDAVTMDIDERFNGIYSNKALCHLRRDELAASFEHQARILTAGGIALHSFWYGDEESYHQGLRFVHYREATLEALIGPRYEVLEAERYTEIDTNDSLYIVLRRRRNDCMPKPPNESQHCG